MYEQLKQFVSTFRELEKQESVLSEAEQENWEKLREKLSQPAPREAAMQPMTRRIIVVASFYPQAGASFLASNYAFHQAGKEFQTILCEPPGIISYFYFALDCERRGVHEHGPDDAESMLIKLQSGMLRIKVRSSLKKRSISHPEWTSWVLANQKEAALMIIDLSSHWRGDLADWIMQVADEVWFILDSDFPRLTRLLLTENPPPIWKDSDWKIKIIANKWNERLAKPNVLKKMEGTLSVWDAKQRGRKIDGFIPLMNEQKVSSAHVKASLYLEKYPEEGKLFEQLGYM